MVTQGQVGAFIKSGWWHFVLVPTPRFGAPLHVSPTFPAMLLRCAARRSPPRFGPGADPSLHSAFMSRSPTFHQGAGGPFRGSRSSSIRTSLSSDALLRFGCSTALKLSSGLPFVQLLPARVRPNPSFQRTRVRSHLNQGGWGFSSFSARR